jgi:purine-binding chemotaxis protein CheW
MTMAEARETTLEFQERHRRMVSFFLEKELFGFEIKYISRVIDPEKMSFVPRAPFFVRGAVSHRGKVIAVIDLAQFLGMKLREITGESKIIILDSQEFHLGFLVDRVERIETVPLAGDTVQEPAGENPYILKVVNLGGRIFNIINLEKLLAEIEGFFG